MTVWSCWMFETLSKLRWSGLWTWCPSFVNKIERNVKEPILLIEKSSRSLPRYVIYRIAHASHSNPSWTGWVTVSLLYTAVFSVVTLLPKWGGALRDDTKNGCVVDLGSFPFVRTYRPDHSHRNDNFPFNQNSLARSVKSWIVCTKEMVFLQKLLEKAYFTFKLTGRAMVRPASSDKSKAP